MTPEEPLLEIDDHEEVEKWEHVEELRLWMKHALGLMVDIVVNDLSKAFFISALLHFIFSCHIFRLCSYWFMYFARFERDLPNEFWFHPCDKGGGNKSLFSSSNSSSFRRSSSSLKRSWSRPWRTSRRKGPS